MKVLGVIPARYQAHRLPGKPLVSIAGRPLVQHVYEAVKASPQLDQIIVATDSEEVAAVVRDFGGAVEMTRLDHRSGTDRTAEVAARHSEFDVVVNVQGDLPLLREEIIEELMAPYAQREHPDMTTVACPLDPELANDPNTVKVVRDRAGRALYFSRAAIPFRTGDADASMLHHIGLYAFRRHFLLRFTTLDPGPLETAESLEQLRALEHGYEIVVGLVEETVMEVNTPEDRTRVEELLAGRPT